MAGILISWIALTNDFTETGVNQNGTTFNYHKYYYHTFNYEKHIILALPRHETRLNFLINELLIHFPLRQIESRLVALEEQSDLNEVRSKVEQILFEHAESNIDIYFSPGSSIMQVAWYVCHTTLGLKTRLLQLKRAEHSLNPPIPDLLQIYVEQSREPVTAILKQAELNKPAIKAPFIIPAAINSVYKQAERIASADNVTTLIYGNSGTGKENLARYIHENSARKFKPYLAVNCGAFTDTLLESELFGHTKGAFTGALGNKKGLFESAAGGTVFLDEIGDISVYMQQALLRVLQEKEIRPVGSSIVKKTDIRIIAATNKDLEQLCNEGKFRRDLYYRLAVVELRLPDLNTWDIDSKNELIKHILDKKAIVYKRTKALKLSAQVHNHLLNFNFRGNIRELENLIDNFYVFCDTEVFLNDLPPKFTNFATETVFSIHDIEKNHIKKVLTLFGGNKQRSARALGFSLNTLKAKIKTYNLDNALD